MKKTIMATAIICALLIMPAHADTIYPDPEVVSEQLLREQLSDERELAEEVPDVPVQTPQQPQQPAQTAPVQQPQRPQEAAPEKEKKAPSEKEKAEEKTDFSEILTEGVTKRVQKDALNLLKRQDLIALKLSESGTMLFPKQFNEKLARRQKTLIVTVYDYTDEPAYQYEIRTRDLPGEDVDFQAGFEQRDDETVRVMLPLRTGKFKTWVKKNTAYAVRQKETRIITSDAKGALVIPVSSDTVTISQKKDHGRKLYIGAGAGALVCVVVIAGLARAIWAKKPEEIGLTDDGDMS